MIEQKLRSLFENASQSLLAVWRINPAISLLVLFSSLALIGSIFGLAFDHRYINGELAWVKPFKFSTSLFLYGASLIFITRFLTKGRALLQATSLAALAGCVVELSAIFVQVLRGAPSHFNLATPLDAALWYLIKVAIMPVALAIVAMLVMLLREKNLPAVLGSAICWGALLTVVGFIPGFLMLMPESLQHVFTNQVMVGHTVGHASNAETIPFIGWSAVVGDLRTAHFIGLHALQVLPLIGYTIGKVLGGLSLIRQRVLVSISGYTYFALILLLTWQALRGESVAAPCLSSLSLYFIMAAASLSTAFLTLLPIKYAELFASLCGNRVPATTR